MNMKGKMLKVIEDQNSDDPALQNLLKKISLIIFVLVCLFIGIAGLLLPIIPALVFLLLAAIVSAEHSQLMNNFLRKNKTLSTYLDNGKGFANLPLNKKIKYALWLCLKTTMDILLAVFNALAKLFSQASRRYPY